MPKPVVIFAAPPAQGHTTHLLPHAAFLSHLAYPVFFIAGPQFEAPITRTGATFVPTENTWSPDVVASAAAVPPGHTPFLWEQRRLFLDGSEPCMRSLKCLLERVADEFPGREVVIIEEMLFMGSWPFKLGAPLPRGYTTFPRIISFSSIPVWVTSVDTAPFSHGIPPDASPAGRERNAQLYAGMEEEHDALTAHANAVYTSLGATQKFDMARENGVKKTMFDAWASRSDLLLLPCPPSLEYPRSDMPRNITFIGPAPRPPLDPSTHLPPWFPELKTSSDPAVPKKVVFVTQGTVEGDTGNLVKPTLQGLAGRKDVLVVAVLGVKGATLDEFEVPENARVVDYLAYHAVLPFADVFVSNGGYGGFMQAVMYGVPMVLAGTTRKFGPPYPFYTGSPVLFLASMPFPPTPIAALAHPPALPSRPPSPSLHLCHNPMYLALVPRQSTAHREPNIPKEDKAEVSARGEHAGIALNLRSDTPTPAQVRAAVDTILFDDRFHSRAGEIRRESEGMDSLSHLEQIIAGSGAEV